VNPLADRFDVCCLTARRSSRKPQLAVSHDTLTPAHLSREAMPQDVSIVLGSKPSRKQPIQYAQLEALAARRPDVGLRVADTGTRARRDTVLVDPTGRIPGELLFIDGRLQIRDPGHDTLQWMIDLADELGGRVRDHTLKTYRTASDTYLHPDDEGARVQLANAIRQARRIDKSPARARVYSSIWWAAIAFALAVALFQFLSRG